MEYKNILLGYPIIVFTDHENNTFIGLKAFLRWLLLLEEYGIRFEYPSRLDIDSLNIQEETEEAFNFSQDQKTTASVISNEQSQCILP
jgi:hypothetical protein